MDKYITDERTGLKYELVGDYYLIAGDDEPEEHHIGIWGQRHLRYLKQNCKTIYAALLTSGKLNDYLADLDEQAEDMFSRLVKELAENEGISEALKTENQMLWVQRKQRGAREGSLKKASVCTISAFSFCAKISATVLLPLPEGPHIPIIFIVYFSSFFYIVFCLRVPHLRV